MFIRDDNAVTTVDGHFNCLVTGAAGFIGHHLCKALRRQPLCRVFALDNLASGTRVNIEYAQPDEFYEADITNQSDLTKIFNERRIDVIFHLAALPRVQFSVDHPWKSNLANIDGTLNMLIAAKDNGIKRFVFSSSSSVYGDQDTLPLAETMKPNPLSPYALQKLAGEIYTQQFYRIYKLPTIALRYFNVYGPRQRAESDYAAAIPKFCKQIIDGKNPTIFGDGEQTRDFTYVEDVVRANIAAMYCSDPEALGEAYNIGGGGRVSVNEIVQQIGKILGLQVNPEYLPAVVESKHTQADLKKVVNLVGWRPRWKFEDGLLQTVNSIREFYNVNS